MSTEICRPHPWFMSSLAGMLTKNGEVVDVSNAMGWNMRPTDEELDKRAIPWTPKKFGDRPNIPP